jgi:hypothetical protein
MNEPLPTDEDDSDARETATGFAVAQAVIKSHKSGPFL